MRTGKRRALLRWGGIGGAVGLLASVLFTVVPLLGATSAPAQTTPTATLALTKGAFVSGTSTPLTSPVTPGEGFDYQIEASCSGLTEGCVNAVTTDVLPPGIDFVGFEPSPLYTVTFDSATNTVTVTYTSALASPPNPPDSVGIEAGSALITTLHVSLSTATTVPNGSTITNTADATADNTNDANSSADITVSIPTVITATATKTVNPTSMVAQSGTAATVTLGVSNASTGEPNVTSLTVADTTAATWDTFNLASVGPVAYPTGADQVSVGICTDPAPCTASEFVNGAPQTGPDISLPVGLDPTTVTGIQFIFTNSLGHPLPPSTEGGSVAVGLILRDTDRSTGDPIDPTTNLTQSNCATPSAVNVVAGTPTTVTGTDACASYTILPGIVGVDVSKQVFPDADGSFTDNGFPVTGQTPPSGVTAVTTAKNTSAFSVDNLTITDPSASCTPATCNFADINPTSLQLTFPTGATDATGHVTCSDGTTVPFSAAAPPMVVIPDVTCPAGTTGTSVTVTFTGTIPSGASGKVAVHAVLTPMAVGGDVLSDCSDATITGTTSSAAGTGCNSLTLQSPSFGVGPGKENTGNPSTDNELVPGEAFNFTLSAQNRSNLPVTAFEIADPSDPPPADSPFPFPLQITSASVSLGGPSSTPAPTFAVEVFDPTTSAWVPFTASAAATASGVRAILTTGVVVPNQTVTLALGTLVSPDTPPGTTITNCQVSTIGQDQGTASASACSPTLTTQPPTTAGSVGKAIVPNTLTAPLPGSAPTAQVGLSAANIGNLPMNRIVITDPNPSVPTASDFFDNVDLVSLGAVHFPSGANQVQVDACLSLTDCQAGTYVLGTPTTSTTPSLPAGVTAANVVGLRFTFSNTSGGFVLNPVPVSSVPGPACPGATACFTVVPRTTLRSTGAPISFPLTVIDFATAAGESPLTTPNLASFGPAMADLTVTPGTPQLGVAKSASPTTVPPGIPITYTLTTTNTGTAAIPGLTITEPLPAGLVFNSGFVGTNGPYSISSTVPAGGTPVPTPTFTVTGSTLVWQWPTSYLFDPTSTVTLTFQANITPGTPGGTVVPNQYGAGSSDAPTMTALTCAGGATKDPTIGCLANASVTTGFGSAVDAQKWVHGDDSLGFFDTLTNTPVAIGDPSCPLLVIGTDNYTRYPCVAEVLAGQNFTFVLDITNVGTTLLTDTRLVDDLPKIGDKGVIVPAARGTEWDPSPTLAAAPTLAPGDPGALTVAYDNTSPGCIDDLSEPPGTCPPPDWTDPLSPAVEAIRAFVTFPGSLPPGGTTAMVLPMSAPTDLTSPPSQIPIAWNSFAHTDFFNDDGTAVQLPAVEPEKAGVALPFGSLEIAKVITGPIPDGSVIGPFTFTYSCDVTPATGTSVTVASGTATIDAVTTPATPTPVTIAGIPVGAVCTITETGTGGGTPTTNPTTVTIASSADPTSPTATVATVTDAFPPPRLIVIKKVTGAAAGLVKGPWTIQVNCTIGGNPVPGFPRNLTFDTPESQSLTDIPVGAECTASEPDTAGASTPPTIVYTPGDPDGPVTIPAGEDAVATVTNPYNAVSLTVTKTVVGPGPAGPWTIHTSCHLTSNTGTNIPVTLPAADATFKLSSGQKHVITVPVGARCTATEVGAPADDTVTYNASTTPVTITVHTDTTLAVTNTFHPPPKPAPAPVPAPAPTAPPAPITPITVPVTG
jgi:uncharacterized repeat protein (TIGR01451 family)